MTATPAPAEFDVAVVGAGPAGSATARGLAQRGWRVGLIERTRFDAPRIGESLAPDIQPLIRDLGVWLDFQALSPLPSWGTRAVWGGEPQQHSHLFSPYRCGWHVDRRAFDEMLARGAVAAGASLLDGMTVRSSVHVDGRWRLRARETGSGENGSQTSVSSRVLVDATGRRASVGRWLGAQVMAFDRLVAVAAGLTGANAGEEGHLLVEAVSDGWWYSAPLPRSGEMDGAEMVAMVMTDADLCHRSRLASAGAWQASLRSAPATRTRLGRARRVSDPRVHTAHSQRLLRPPGGGTAPWLAVGDAALAVDPLSGSGVVRALRTARAAVDAVSSLLSRPAGWPDVLAAYEAERDEECTLSLIERAEYYAAEDRFDSPFWQRRRVLPSGPSEGSQVAS